MKIQKFKKLEDEVKKKDFESSYGGLNNLMKGLSILGNLGSIFAASFFMMKLMGGLISSGVIVVIVSFILLISLELIKRVIFNKFSLEFIRSKYNLVKKEVLILMLFSICIICASFYSSLNGAKEFADRDNQIETVITTNISNYEDSLRVNIYQPKIDDTEQEIVDLKVDIKKKDDELTRLNSVLSDRGWLSSNEKRRIKDLKEEIKYNREQIILKENRTVSIQKELDNKVTKYKNEVESKGNEKKDTNKSSGLIFVAISTIIEFIILIGIFFAKYYSYTSYSDFRKKMDKDPKYQKWVLYSEVMDIIFMNDAVVGDKLPTQKDILEFSKMNDIYLSKHELSEFFKLLGALKIVKSNGPYKTIHKEKEEAEDIISKYFKICYIHNTKSSKTSLLLTFL